jgi:hypothetical protein
MIMLLESVGLLILRQIFAELVLTNQITLDQKIKGVINRGTTYTIVFSLHTDV